MGNRLNLQMAPVSQSGSKKSSVTSIINSEYDQESPQSQTADKPVAPQGRATQ